MEESSEKKLPVAGELEAAMAAPLASLTDYVVGSVVSRTLAKSKAGTMTVFAFDAGQGLSEHSAPFDAYVCVLDGRALVTIGGKPVDVGAGEIVRMPANVSHALHAAERFKMLLIMLRG